MGSTQTLFFPNQRLSFASLRAHSISESMSFAAVHDLPIVGHFTLAAHQHYAGLFGTTEEEELAAFHKMDKNNTGVLDKTELGHTLLEMGKSEREVQMLLDDIAEPELNFEQFKELVSPSYESYTVTHEVPLVGTSVTLPNPRKAH